MSDPDDQPSNVKDLLAEAKDASELMVDLAYAAVFFNDEKLAQEVEDLQQRLYGYLRRLRQFVNLIREIAGAPSLPEPPEVGLPALTELGRAVDILIEMKNSSEVAVGLAYSALLFQRRALAAEVAALEARSDILHDELESWVLK